MKMYEPKARIATATSWTVARAACRSVFHMVIRLGDGPAGARETGLPDGGAARYTTGSGEHSLVAAGGCRDR
ncbi:hypothetical protein GCM10023084_20270 [Streptomyces lacrimifluminis]|uniref:Uncharacterized protein n=1 Tax=Streptomyces lacrimifluminis TaxID=1500077 RepID=A0A917NW31_9ACTN|nr:hypothetical protein GCM10012282_34480 [Streptomyces lacrimifluminis]